ncbi:hypothetical protein ACVH9Z_21200 [Rhodococcus opacus]|uniref:hypothetical protein n=1 Tax=Rhodococcus opacus TaxID=37919 RepID=UPI0012DB6C3B|nr:hypothetical protein [Rhodococcus opacus]
MALAPNGATIATLTIPNNASGFSDALAWIAEHAPGPASWSDSKAPAATESAWLAR